MSETSKKSFRSLSVHLLLHLNAAHYDGLHTCRRTKFCTDSCACTYATRCNELSSSATLCSFFMEHSKMNLKHYSFRAEQLSNLFNFLVVARIPDELFFSDFMTFMTFTPVNYTVA